MRSTQTTKAIGTWRSWSRRSLYTIKSPVTSGGITSLKMGNIVRWGSNYVNYHDWRPFYLNSCSICQGPHIRPNMRRAAPLQASKSPVCHIPFSAGGHMPATRCLSKKIPLTALESFRVLWCRFLSRSLYGSGKLCNGEWNGKTLARVCSSQRS